MNVKFRQKKFLTFYIPRKNKTTTNSDGLIKCLLQRQDRFVINPNIYVFKLCSIYKNAVAPGQFRLPGQHHWRCRPTCRCLVFCSSPRLFRHDTKLHCHLSGLVTVSQIHRDTKLTAGYRDWLKTRHRDADGT
jgi:hypothetical protein